MLPGRWWRLELTSSRAGNDPSEIKHAHPSYNQGTLYISLVLCSKVRLLILGWLTLINVQVREVVVASLCQGWHQYHVITGGVNVMAVYVEHNAYVPNGRQQQCCLQTTG